MRGLTVKLLAWPAGSPHCCLGQQVWALDLRLACLFQRQEQKGCHSQGGVCMVQLLSL